MVEVQFLNKMLLKIGATNAIFLQVVIVLSNVLKVLLVKITQRILTFIRTEQ